MGFVVGFGAVPMNISGDEAREFLDRWQSVTAWLLQDTGEAKVSPEELGIARIEEPDVEPAPLARFPIFFASLA